MSDIKMVHRIEDGVVFKAVRYGRVDGSWGPECITKVAAFVLGINPDVSTSVANERMLDVVHPIYKNFNPTEGVADIEVVDPVSGLTFEMSVGDWILKNPFLSFIFVKPYAFDRDFGVAQAPSKTPKEAEFDGLAELASIIYKHGIALEKAETVARNLIQAGWSKKENTL